MGRLLNIAGLAVGLFALVVQFVLSMEMLLAGGRSIPGAVVHYFSYFTILTNVLVTLTHLSALTGRPAFFGSAGVRGGVTVSIIIVALVYWTLLAGLEHLVGMAIFTNVLLHAVAPAIMVVWWLAAGADGSLSWRNLPWWLVYPVAYIVYVFLRAPIAGEVPYPFLNVGTEGLPHVLTMIAGITVLFIALGAVAIVTDRFIGRARRRRLRAAG